MVVVLIGYHAYLRIFIRPKVDETLNRINLIAAGCSYIECLEFHYIEEETLEILRGTLDDVTVKWLWINEQRLIDQTKQA